MMRLCLRAFFIFTGALLLAGCTGLEKQSKAEYAPEVHTEITQGYLPADALPDSLALLPPPPAEGTAAFALDEAISRNSLALQGSPRWKLAAEDADLSFPQVAATFSCALGIPISEQDTPCLYRLMRRTFFDARLSTYTAKNRYRRIRPFAVNGAPTCTPEKEHHMREVGAYPSGHTALGWAWALILSELSPEHADALLERGWAYGQSRVVCNVHWQSDVTMGRIMGAAAVARLHADLGFRAAMDAARKELEDVRGRRLKPTRGCKAEADALSQSIPSAPWPANK
ncbi:MAG: phosphatase PAP2 family protein [Campylobacterales bacterium]|jgi:acid phosphatase (class A)